MKKTKLMNLATITALSSTLILGAVPVVADTLGEARDVKTDADIEFKTPEPGKGPETEVTPPETEPEVEIPPTVPGSTGPLTIAYAPALNFGAQDISAQSEEYFQIAELQKAIQPDEEGNDVYVPYISFAQVQDTRGTNTGWDLQVSLSAFKASKEDALNPILEGAEIHFNQNRLNYNADNDSDNPQAPSIHAVDGNANVLPATGEKINLMNAADKQGSGTSSIIWGDQDQLNNLADLAASEDAEAIEAAQEEKFLNEDLEVLNQAISLHIPGKTAKDADAYKATLTWTLTSVADNELEED